MPAACPASGLSYRRWTPEKSDLYGAIAEGLPLYLERAAVDPTAPGVPAFVERELRAYLRCGDTDSSASVAKTAATIGQSRCLAKGAACVRAAAVGGWPSLPPTSSTV